MIKAYRRTSFRYDFIRENHEKEINFSFKFVSQEGKDKKKPHFKGLNLHFEFFNIKTKEIINIVTQDENICPVCGASIKPEYSNWNDCYEYYNWECQQCEAKGTAVYKMIRNFEEHIDIEKGEQL